MYSYIGNLCTTYSHYDLQKKIRIFLIFQKLREDILLVAFSSVDSKVEIHPEINQTHPEVNRTHPNGHPESRVDVL